MANDNPYDQQEQDARDEDRRRDLQDGAEEAENERRQLGPLYWTALDDEDGYPADQDEEMTVGLDCCPHFVPYGSDCDRCDDEDQGAAYELNNPKRSDFLDRADILGELA